MSDDIALRVTNLSKCFQIYDKPQDRIKQAIFGRRKRYYREFWALRDINFEIKKGEAFGIIGRNGSGKSTLLQLLCQILTPTTGQVEIKGRVAALLELGAGFKPEFTGRENVYINGAILGFSRKEIDTRFDEIAAFADIGDFIDQPVKNYSSGMFVRLAFAVQACVNPDILIIDEALAVGDMFFRQKCYGLIEKFLEKGVSIILVTHALNEVEQICDRALILKKGVQKFVGHSREAVRRFYFVEQESQKLSPSPNAQIISENKSETTNYFWPKKSEFIDISKVKQITNGWATCTALAICDAEGNHCQAFQQGETASFFYEFEILQDIEIPITAILISNDKGVVVHGKGTLEYGTELPLMARGGDILRIRQNIALELGFGDYTFEVGLGTINHSDYSQRKLYSYEKLYASTIILCNLSNVAIFEVLPRAFGTPVQLLHHGIANLPGDCSIIKISKNVSDQQQELILQEPQT